MNISPTYRLLLAVFLTALYAFIATPVQVWHHHHNSSKKVSVATGEPSSRSVVLKSIQSEEEVDCPVCTHHYSIFAEDSVVPFLTIPSFLAKAYADYRLPAITGSYISFSNKGPPTMA